MMAYLVLRVETFFFSLLFACAGNLYIRNFLTGVDIATLKYLFRITDFRFCSVHISLKTLRLSLPKYDEKLRIEVYILTCLFMSMFSSLDVSVGYHSLFRIEF